MRDDSALLLDMLIASRKIAKFTTGVSFEKFKTDELIQSAVIREFQVIGEAARMISDKTKTQQSEIAWKVISGMRNRLIHEYFSIRLDVVWQTITDDIPTLISQLESLIPPDTD